MDLSKSIYIKTPLFELPMQDGKTAYLKMDAYQPCGSFKLRGMDCIGRYMIERGAERLISSSGGNAGLAVAYVGRAFGIPVTVVVPQFTSAFMIQKLKDQRADVVVFGDVWDEAHEHAMSLADDSAAYIPPFDHPKIWQGHATLVDELKDQMPQPDLVILSVGGGGLLNGVVEGLVRNGWESTAVLAVETPGAASLYDSVKAGRLITLDKIDTIATSLGAKRVSEASLRYAQQYRILPHLVDDERAARAVVRFANDYRVLVEPACGASLAAVFDADAVLREFERVAVVVCGGAAVNAEKLAEYERLARV